jgi:shikimate dehydrogenase
LSHPQPYYRFAVLGNPVEHSRSPQIHEAMLRIAGLAGEYRRIQADEAVLSTAVEELRTGHWEGLNITMPLKAAAARLADSLSPTAERSGSVNTLVRMARGVRGDTTDSWTFRYLIDSVLFAARTSVLLLGAGGSAAAALAALEDEPNVYVAARRGSTAGDLTSRLGGNLVSWGTAVAGALVINTTPLGMSGEHLPEGILEVASGLIDLPYGPKPTPAIETADRLSLPSCDGHEFLLRQAMGSFQLWTGVQLRYETVSGALRNT